VARARHARCSREWLIDSLKVDRDKSVRVGYERKPIEGVSETRYLPTLSSIPLSDTRKLFKANMDYGLQSLSYSAYSYTAIKTRVFSSPAMEPVTGPLCLVQV